MKPLVKVTSRSFSSHAVLRSELLKNYPDAVFNDNMVTYDDKALFDYFRDADAVVVGLEKITEKLISECPKLKIVSKYGVGLDNIDESACKMRGIKIGWTGGLNRRGVAEMAICFMIGLSRHIFFSERNLRTSDIWTKDGGFDLTGKTVGIIGVGNVGKEVIQLLKPFSCKILGNDIIEQTRYYNDAAVAEVSKEEIYATSDIISIHAPLTDETYRLFDHSVFAKMKSNAYLINLARGAIVKQDDLKETLYNRQIAGAAIDVFEVEPCDDKNFLQLPNLYCTPHTGGSSQESILTMGRSAIRHLNDYFQKR